MVQLVRQIEARDESRKLSSRNIRKELHTLNRDIIRQSKPDQDQRTKMLDLMKKLNYTKEDEPEMRLAKAKHFMEEREGQGSTNNSMVRRTLIEFVRALMSATTTEIFQLDTQLTVRH